jgi:ligand-binding sensor domain-containing protein/serine phosphatase RsbU (regulator of sigma subunit)
MQDKHGFMWFGTQEGLNRYDGYNIKIYKHEPDNRNSLSYSEVNCMYELKDNRMVIGTPVGLNFLDLTNDSIKHVLFNEKDNNAKENYVNVVKPVDERRLVVGTNKGVILFDVPTGKYELLPFKTSVEVICKDAVVYNNKVLLGTNKGLWELDLRSNRMIRIDFDDKSYMTDGIVPLEAINKLSLYANKLYVGTNGSGVFKIDPVDYQIMTQRKFRAKNNDMNYIKDLVIKQNSIYCATGSGFVIYNILSDDTASFLKKPHDPYSLNDNIINAVYLDNSENIWLGTFLGGINVAFKSTEKFRAPLKYKLNQFKNLFLTFQDNQGNVWLSGDVQLNMLPKNGSAFKNYNNITGKFDALCAYQESNTIYWFGTYGDGLKRYDAATGKVTSFLSNQNGGTILSITRLDNYLLAGSFGEGLFKIDLRTNEVMQYGANEGLTNTNVTKVFVDNKKTIWVLTDGGGAFHIENFSKTSEKLKLIKRYLHSLTEESSIPSDVVYSMNQDRNGLFWFGTGSGLSRYDGKSFRNFYEADGLANTFIYSILEDSTGRFWMSTNKGITSFNPLGVNKPFFKNYNLKDGLTNTEHNIGAAYASSSGNILFGGANGYNIFRPSLIKDNLHVPPVYVISYKRSGKDIPIDSNLIYKKQLTLSWRENYFQMEVVALDFIDPGKNLFKYKLEGYDKEWSEPSNVRYISYTELPGGNYILKIKASNSDGVWNEVPYELNITIVPPFWKTTWFYVLVVIIGTAGIFLFTQWRTRKIKEENKQLENKVAERTRELAEKNRDITSSIEYAKRIQEAILPSKDYIFSKLQRAFILYKPKDIVSGDFYWFGEKNGWKIFAVVDCTGHGVPGAFMSMIGHNLMHQIIQEKGIVDPGGILNALHKGVQESLRQGSNEINTNDGMDVSIIALNDSSKQTLWAGANRPLILITNDGEFDKLDGNKYPIGGSQFDIKREFTTRSIQLNKPSMAYLFSDGYADQFGGDKGKKFMVKRFHDLLMDIHLKDINQQRDLLNAAFEEWRKGHEQIDDVLVVGVAL